MIQIKSVKFWQSRSRPGNQVFTLLIVDTCTIVIVAIKFLRYIESSIELTIAGTALGYHAYTIAMYMNELITRVDPKHRTLSQFFREEIAVPFGKT